MWLIVEVDTEIEYPNTYGPFDTKEDAEAALPEADKTGTVYWHVTELKAPSQIIHEPEIIDNTPVRKDPLDELVDTYGAIENIPAPNPNVYAYANRHLGDLRATIKNGPHADPEEQAHRFAQVIYLEELARHHRPRAGF